jgi:hypothetical protein
MRRKNMTSVNTRWRAKINKYYYYIDSTMRIRVDKDTRDSLSIKRYNVRNYFACKKDARAILAFFSGLLFSGPKAALLRLEHNH